MLVFWLGLGTKKTLGYGEENITFWLKIPAVVVAKKKNTPQLQIARILVQIYFFCHHKRGLSPSCLQNIQWCDIYKCRNAARPPCHLQLHLRPLNLYTWQSGNKHVLGCEHVCSLHKRLTASVFSWWLGCFPSWNGCALKMLCYFRFSKTAHVEISSLSTHYWSLIGSDTSQVLMPPPNLVNSWLRSI